MSIKKVNAVVKFSKGVTISKDFQSVRYDVGLEPLVPRGEMAREAYEMALDAEYDGNFEEEP